MQLTIAIQVLYATSISLIKISICLFYNRIFPFHKLVIASWIIIGLTCAWTAAAILYDFLACRPVASFWESTTAKDSCVNNLAIPRVIIGALDVALDVAICILPLPYLWKLQIRLPYKIAIGCIFGVGIWYVTFRNS